MPLQPLKLLTDQPIHENQDGRGDGLGFTAYAETLAGAALGTEGPFTIGVFGDWGTGKTSLMRMVERQLIPQENVLTVWFEAWRYGREEHPIIPLVSTIIREIESQSKKNKRKIRFSKLLDPLRSFVYGISLKVKADIFEAEISPRDMIDRSQAIKKEREEKEVLEQLFVLDSLYYDAYDALSQLRLGGENGRIVLFIDDLDRCLPDVAVQLLESIKLVLSQAGFIFVLGMSRPVIDGYLNKRYREDFGLTDFVGREYLDKIVQLAFYIPPHQKRMENFAQSILTTLSKEDQRHLDEILPLIGIACGYSPRTTIRFVNNLLIDKSILPKSSIGYSAITRSLQQHWFRFFSLLTQSNSDTLCQYIRSWLKDPSQDYKPHEESTEYQLIKILRKDSDLQDLLNTSQGVDWLENHDSRSEAIQFLESRANTLDFYDEKISRMVNLGLHNLNIIGNYDPILAKKLHGSLDIAVEKGNIEELFYILDQIRDIRNRLSHGQSIDE